MAKEICISSTPHETRLAILEDDQLSEIYYERENEYTLAGSIYKGRVTRVLPGMQSAFVDIGLERDAFLYVTDFMEMEEPEDADELERAATQGTPIRQPATQNEGSRRSGDRDRGSERPALNDSADAQEFSSVTTSEGSPGQAPTAGEEEDAAGGRRMRGRRRRRGGRGGREDQPRDGASGSSEFKDVQSGEHIVDVERSEVERFDVPAPMAFGLDVEETPVRFVADDSEAKLHVRASSRNAGRRDRSSEQVSSTPFVLPGESLARYGASPSPSETRSPAPRAAATEPSAAPVARVAPKPSTLIETEIQWDGKGLLPGESLARHRNQPMTAGAAPSLKAGHEVMQEASHEAATANAAEGGASIEFQEEEELLEGSARHDADPIPPSAFRLKDLFGSDRKEDAAEKGKKKSGVGVSARASGDVEEEEMEVEEYELSHKGSRAPRHSSDVDDKTLQQQVRSGVIGEMLHEVQLETHMRPGRSAEPAPGRDGGGRGGRQGRSGSGRDGRDGSGRNRGSGRSESGRSESSREDRGVTERGAPDRGQGERSQGERSSSERSSSERSSGDGRRPMSRRASQTSDLPIISDLLKPGQEILVQIAKEPIAQKGARITSHIALPGRFLVFMPTVSHVGVSRKIESDEERQRLKRILLSERGEATGGFIVRTAAEGASEEELRADLRFLIHLWSEIRQRAESSKPPALIYHDLNLIERILRDQVSDDFSQIWVDSEADYERIVRFLNRFSPDLVRRVKLYTKEVPLFEHFGIQDEISKALRSKVWLKSGGSIVINQTEALVAIDINTGKYVGKTARLEDTILKTNLDAIPEIVRQIRLRDLGGIIVIDFIDMDERRNRARVLTALEEALKQDRAPTKVLQFNDFGLVAITRKRVKQSLERTLSVPCPVCQATGMVKSPATVANEIYTEMRKMRKHFDQSEITLRVHPETAKVLKAGNARWLGEFETLTGKSVLVKNDATLHPEQFDIQG